MSPAIETRGLTKHYGDVPAVVDLDLTVQTGEVFGFLGPNGAGKTTTIRTLLDEIRPTRGTASILGLDSHRDAVAIRTRIGYIPGDLALYPNLTGRDTLRFFANLRGGVDWGYVDALAERLQADLAKKVADLSSGNRQKIGIIQAFMNRPELLILDEPSIGLDPLMQHEFQQLLRETTSEGRTVFLSSHSLSEVQKVADRVGIIRRGRLVAVETVDDLRTKAIRRVEIEFAERVDADLFAGVPGVREALVENHRVVLSYEGRLGPLLEAVAGRYQVEDVSTREADLEEIFLTYYRGEAGGAEPAAVGS